MKRHASRKRILVVDDEASQHGLIGDFLERKGFVVQSVSDATSAIEHVKESAPEMVVMDVRMPGMDGLEALKVIREESPALPVLLITAYADVRDAVRAMRDGAVDYLTKPVDLDELAAAIEDAIGPTMPTSQKIVLPSLPEGILFASETMRETLEQLALVAPSDATVMLTGESGTGKEILADILHRWSPRRDGPLVKVNCAAVPDNLLESELFGYEPGAFTGATRRKPGRFEAAHGGTLLLDEIAEMSPALQAKLLRVLQDHFVMRLGSTKHIEVDFRLVAATNQDIEQAIRESRFREDLFYRLNVVAFHVPPLRDRRPDIAPLARRFASEFAEDKVRISPSALRCLEAYDWPGNIRELRNEIERACLLCRGNVILLEHLSPRVSQAARDRTVAAEVETTLADVEKATILHTLEECGGNRTQAAKKLGISRRTLIYKLKSY